MIAVSRVMHVNWIKSVVEAFAAQKVQAAERYRDAQQAAS